MAGGSADAATKEMEALHVAQTPETKENLNKAASVESDIISSKEPKVADSNGATPGAQSSPPEDDDDGPSEDGVAVSAAAKKKKKKSKAKKEEGPSSADRPSVHPC